MRFTFTCADDIVVGEHKYDSEYGIGSNHYVEMSFDAVSLDTVLSEFNCFLRGCGFYPSGDRLEFVDDTIQETEDECENT